MPNNLLIGIIVRHVCLADATSADRGRSEAESNGGGQGLRRTMAHNGRITACDYGSICRVIAFQLPFTRDCAMQVHPKLFMIRQPELVECDFAAKRIDQSAVVQEIGCPEGAPCSFFRFGETATFRASSCERS
jgi:hypothetical protein